MKQKKSGMLLFVLASVLMLTSCFANTEKTTNQNASETNLTLTFSASNLNQEPTFVDWTQGDIAMQLIARKDESGSVRLAFNTCQSCSGSPYAWFEYLGNNTLQCQNCGQTFPLDTVGITRDTGCNPVTVTEFTVEGDTVTVPQYVLADNAKRFINWKKIER